MTEASKVEVRQGDPVHVTQAQLTGLDQFPFRLSPNLTRICDVGKSCSSKPLSRQMRDLQ